MITNNEEIWVQGKGDDEFSKPIEYGDISILIRSRRHLPEIEHALLSAGIPYLTTGGVGFYQRQEIYDIWNYLSFLNAPQEKRYRTYRLFYVVPPSGFPTLSCIKFRGKMRTVSGKRFKNIYLHRNTLQKRLSP